METTGDERMWLGNNSVLPNYNRITLPQMALKSELVARAESLNWGAIKNEDRVVVSRFKKSFSKLKERRKVDIKRFTSQSVGENAVAIIPKQFFPDYEGKAKWSQSVGEALQFNYGETLHFMTTNVLARFGLCYVLNDEDARDMVNEFFGGDLATDGGQKQELRQAERDIVIPEADTKPGLFLHIDSGESISRHTFKQLVFDGVGEVELEKKSITELIEDHLGPDDFDNLT